APYSEPGGYINFMQDDDYHKIRDNYRQNYDRLVQVKRAYDPGNLFHINQNIAPLAQTWRGPRALRAMAPLDPDGEPTVTLEYASEGRAVATGRPYGNRSSPWSRSRITRS